MIGCLQTRVRKQPITAFYFESETALMFYNLEARFTNVYSISSESLFFFFVFGMIRIRTYCIICTQVVVQNEIKVKTK